MAMYVYLCGNCGERFDDVSSIKQRHLKRKCPHCGGWGKRDVKSELRQFGRVNAMMKDNPRWSEALGINPVQEADFRKSFPNLDLTFDKTGRCLVKNRKHKLALMKARGFQEIE